MKRCLSIIVLMACTAAVYADVVFTPPEWLFGEIGASTPIELTCTIDNTEDQTLQVRILPTCGCLSVEPPELSIASGGQAEITLFYDPVDDSGVMEHFFIIQTNLDALQKALFSVRGTIYPDGEAESPDTEFK